MANWTARYAGHYFGAKEQARHFLHLFSEDYCARKGEEDPEATPRQFNLKRYLARLWRTWIKKKNHVARLCGIDESEAEDENDDGDDDEEEF